MKALLGERYKPVPLFDPLAVTVAGYIGYTPPPDAEIIEFVVIKLGQFTDGLVEGFPTAVPGDEFMERHGR